MSIITSHLEQLFEEVLAERAYNVSQVRKVLVTGTRLMQKAVKKIDRYYNKTLRYYPELMTTEELIKAACAHPAREDHFIITTLQPLQSKSKHNDAPSTTVRWYRKTYSDSVFPSGKFTQTAGTEPKKVDDKELFIKTEVLDKLDESLRKKTKGKKTKKPQKNDNIFKL